MIPRSRHTEVQEPTADAERPEGLPPVPHQATDYDFGFTSGVLLPVSIIDGNGTIDEQPDRYIFMQGGEQLTILKNSLAYVRRRDRTFTTDPELFKPDR